MCQGCRHPSLTALGWEPLTAGGLTGLRRQGEQMKHPRQAEDDGEFQVVPDGDKSVPG